MGVKRSLMRARMVVAATTLLVLAASFLWRVASPFDHRFSCSWRGEEAFKSAETYVKAFVPDASNFETVDYGCVELASRGMTFASGVAPRAVRDTFVNSAECHQVLVSGEPVPTEADLCGNAKYEFFILLSPGDAGGSTGALSVAWL